MIYADCNATHPVSESHMQQVSELFLKVQGNASSPHSVGRNAHVAVSNSRNLVSKHTGFETSGVIFLSGGTEANNLGTVGVLKEKISTSQSFPVHVLTSALEHPCVNDALKNFAEAENKKNAEKFPQGIVTLEIVPYPECMKAVEFGNRIQTNTVLVTFMAANNESGWILPYKEFSEELHSARWDLKKTTFFNRSLLAPENSFLKKTLQDLHFHCDTVQAFGKVEQAFLPGQDSAAICAHKLGGLPGIGALLLRKGRRFAPLLAGGSQERSRRAGTENVLGILSLGMLCEQLDKKLLSWDVARICSAIFADKVEALSSFESLNKKEGLETWKNISAAHASLPNTLFYEIANGTFNAEDLVVQFDMLGVCLSTGSACSSAVSKPSVVLKAIGKSEQSAKESLRISFGLQSKIEDAKEIIVAVSKIYQLPI